MNDWIWNIGRMILTEENQSNRRKTFSIPSLSVTNPTWLALDWTQNLAVTARQPPVTPFFRKYGRKSDKCFVYRDLSMPLNVHKGIYPDVLNVSLISCSGVSNLRLFAVTWLHICWTEEREMRPAGESHCYTVCIIYRIWLLYPSVICSYVSSVKSHTEFQCLLHHTVKVVRWR